MSLSPPALRQLILSAAQGDPESRVLMVSEFEPILSRFFRARWQHTPGLRQDVQEAVQELFVELFRDQGPLQNFDPQRPEGFIPFLLGVARNVGRRIETQRSRRCRFVRPDSWDRVPGRELECAAELDYRLVYELIQQAWDLHWERAHASGDEAVRRAHILHLRIQHDISIREIAVLWDTDATHLHRQYARARREFRRVVLDLAREQMPTQLDALGQNLLTLLNRG